MTRTIYLYDSTLRDGAQTSGVDFTVADKQSIACALDQLGIDYIEAGWPGANPTDDQFFANLPELTHSRFTAFGMTRRLKAKASEDQGLQKLLDTELGHLCIVGKTWDFHVKEALGTTLDANLEMIHDSITHLVGHKREVLFDAEHFFDGVKANADYAYKVLQTAHEAGARWLVLCDTNGGSLPDEIGERVKALTQTIPGEQLAIHCHNDTEQAVANSLAAVRAGACQIQGTINGVGERCGNANLISVIPNLILKMGLSTSIDKEKLVHLTQTSHFLDDRLNRASNIYAAYVGSSAFAHKGGLHVSAVAKDPSSYEHIDPEQVGNKRQILVSDQAGRSNILARLKELGINPEGHERSAIDQLVDEVKRRESKGYAYDNADASFALLAKRHLGQVPEYFKLEHFRVLDERRWNAKGELVTLSEATVRVRVKDELVMTVAEGNGPVNALDTALRKALSKEYPSLESLKLVDYKVRIIDSSDGTEATTRVFIESKNAQGNSWITIGVSANIIDASYAALRDSIIYQLGVGS